MLLLTMMTDSEREKEIDRILDDNKKSIDSTIPKRTQFREQSERC